MSQGMGGQAIKGIRGRAKKSLKPLGE